MSNPVPVKLSSLEEEYQKKRKEFRKFALIRIFLYLLIVPIFILVIFFLRRSQNDDIAIRKIKKRTTFLVGVLPVLLLFLFVFIYHLIPSLLPHKPHLPLAYAVQATVARSLA